MVCYIVAQFAGAFAASGLLWWLGEFEEIPDYAAPHIQIPVVKALVFQMMGSWNMILVTLAAIDKRRGHADCFLQPFAIGLSITCALLFLGPYAVTGLNPCVVAWYVVSGSTWTNLWIFFFSPFLGTATAVGIYNGLLRPYEKAPSRDGIEYEEAELKCEIDI